MRISKKFRLKKLKKKRKEIYKLLDLCKNHWFGTQHLNLLIELEEVDKQIRELN